ncbi:hypothetical protein ACFPRL_11585 [Pseudoclavibacter helvolus]
MPTSGPVGEAASTGAGAGDAVGWSLMGASVDARAPGNAEAGR